MWPQSPASSMGAVSSVGAVLDRWGKLRHECERSIARACGAGATSTKHYSCRADNRIDERAPPHRGGTKRLRGRRSFAESYAVSCGIMHYLLSLLSRSDRCSVGQSTMTVRSSKFAADGVEPPSVGKKHPPITTTEGSLSLVVVHLKRRACFPCESVERQSELRCRQDAPACPKSREVRFQPRNHRGQIVLGNVAVIKKLHAYSRHTNVLAVVK